MGTVSPNWEMEERTSFQVCFILVVEECRKNSNGLWMFSEVAHNELKESRPWDKIWGLWTSEKTKWFLSLCPGSATTRWGTQTWNTVVPTVKSSFSRTEYHTENALRIQLSLAGNSRKINMKITGVKFYFPKYSTELSSHPGFTPASCKILCRGTFLILFISSAYWILFSL